MSESIESFVRGLPKAELHVHIQGAASAATVLELARRHPELGVPTEAEALRRFYTFTDFAHFIEVYISVNRLVRTTDDVRSLRGRARTATWPRSQVRYAEVTVTPDSHLLMGIAPDALADALAQARDGGARPRAAWSSPGSSTSPASSDWSRGCGPSTGSSGTGPSTASGSGSAVPSRACRARSSGTCSPVRARLGLHSVPHAGESTGPQTIRDSLDLLGARPHRARDLRGAGPGPDGRAGRAGRRARGVPDVQRLHAGGAEPGRAPVPRLLRRPGCG